MKKLPKKSRPLLIIILIGVLIGVGVFYFLGPESKGLVKLERYRHYGGEAICLSMGPECGNCYGELRGKECYVTPEERDRWE